MTRPTEPGDRRPTEARERNTSRLRRAPGDRYAGDVAPDETTERSSLPRAAGLAMLWTIAGVVAIVVLGGVLSLSAGLIVVAGAIGWAIGLAMATARAEPSRLRWTIAVTLAIDAIVLGQVGLWLHSLWQGGALGPIDYLVQTWGLLIPVEIVAAAAVAWWVAR